MVDLVVVLAAAVVVDLVVLAAVVLAAAVAVDLVVLAAVVVLVAVVVVVEVALLLVVVNILGRGRCILCCYVYFRLSSGCVDGRSAAACPRAPMSLPLRASRQHRNKRCSRMLLS